MFMDMLRGRGTIAPEGFFPRLLSAGQCQMPGLFPQ
jgi:hypothetical protein